MKLIKHALETLMDRWQNRVRSHVSSERVSAGCEVFLVAAWLYEHCPWV
ncbi:hypothetical protein AB0907_23915 [Streptomyces sp. NPDC006975]